MASFPTTNITYATRSAGQAIASAHINSLQDEIAAIELGYLTGTARLNAAGSTVATLSVTGGSTFAGVATFANAVTALRGVSYTFPAADGAANTVLQTNGSATLSWEAVSSKPFVQWTPAGNNPPATIFATVDTRNSHLVLDFDGATDEEAVFAGVLPTAYAGGGLTVELWVAFTSATSGTARWQADIEATLAETLDIDADSFTGTFQSAACVANATSGIATLVTITFTSGAQMDSLAAGGAFRLKVRRDADGTSGTDDIATDAELLRVVVRET